MARHGLLQIKPDIPNAKDDRMEEQMQQLLTECVNYFKKKKVYNKLFNALRKKYASLGHMGGTINLKGLPSNERHDLEGFLKKDFGAADNIKISFTLMEKSLKQSRFASLSWEEILTAYFEEPLVIKKQEKAEEIHSKNSFFNKCILYLEQNYNTDNTNIQDILKWFADIWQQNGKGRQILIKMYNEDNKTRSGSSSKENTYIFITKIFKAFASLPYLKNQTLTMPVFAAQTTGNPHFFDLNTPACRLLISFIESLPGTDIEQTGLSEAEYMENLFYKAGILKDSVSNMCLAYGIHAIKKDGSMHEGIEGYYSEKEPVQITLKTLSTLGKIWTGKNHPETGVEKTTEIEKIYIVENPSVFSYLVDIYPDKAFICGNGQFKLAFYITLELLEDKTLLYYAGDFDADGLLIAQKLKNRYSSQVKLWAYNPKYYNSHISDVKLSNIALTKLEKVTAPELQQIKQCLLEHKRAVYQEAMLEAYILED